MVPGLRGTILDRHGDALAASEDAATIYATPYQVKNPPKTADKAGLDPRRKQKGEVLQGLTTNIRLLLRRPQRGAAGRRRGSNG